MIIPFIAADLREVSPLVLAYIGDSVYELHARCHVATKGAGNSNKMHKKTIGYVCASAQAKVVKRLINEGYLNEEEMDYFKRGRNSDPHSFPKNADPLEYKIATGFEALIGFLFLNNSTKRLELLLNRCFEILDEEPEEK